MNITHAEWGWNANEFNQKIQSRTSTLRSAARFIASKNQLASRVYSGMKKRIRRPSQYNAPIRDNLINYAANNFQYLILSAYSDQVDLFEKIYPVKHIYSFSNTRQRFTRNIEEFFSTKCRKVPTTIDTYLSLQHVFESTVPGVSRD